MAKYKKTPYQLQKKKTDDWCSRFIRLRDVTITSFPYGLCYTCFKPVHVKDAHSGHYKSRMLGGSSGIYFDERAIHLQCEDCNVYHQGRPKPYRKHLIKEYGIEVVEELDIKHKVNIYTYEQLIDLEKHFKTEALRMCDEFGIDKWWR